MSCCIWEWFHLGKRLAEMVKQTVIILAVITKKLFTLSFRRLLIF